MVLFEEEDSPLVRMVSSGKGLRVADWLVALPAGGCAQLAAARRAVKRGVVIEPLLSPRGSPTNNCSIHLGAREKLK